MKLKELKGKKVLILGFAREGGDTLRFLRRYFPKKIIGIADQKSYISNGREKYVIWHLGKDYLKALKKYDVIIKAPGIAPYVIAPFLKTPHHITSQTDIFFENCENTIIGVTGTKGKSTTASLIHHILQSGGARTRLIGNIGEPALSYLAKAKPEDIFVYELSSFQLESLKVSPHIAVFLNLYPEHLDHHKTFGAYAKAKANITLHQGTEDFLVYNAKDAEVRKIAKKSRAQKLPFLPKPKRGLSPHIAGTVPALAAVEPAILVGKLFGVSDSKIKQAIKNFKSLPHRLEDIGEYKNIRFVNDSLATIPEATMAALGLLGNQVATLIAGGYDRGVSMTKLARRIDKSGIQTLILFPDTGKKILQDLKRKPTNVFFAQNMKEAVQLAYQHTPKGKTCLLSPAASSFNLFRDYQDRGNQFTKFVKRYGS